MLYYSYKYSLCSLWKASCFVEGSIIFQGAMPSTSMLVPWECMLFIPYMRDVI